MEHAGDHIDHLSLVELLPGDARDALALLHEAERGRLLEATRHAHDVVHRVAVEAGVGGHDHVVVASLLELVEGQELGLLRLEALLLDELEERLAQCRQPELALEVDGHRTAQLARQVAQLGDAAALGQRALHALECDAAASAGPRAHEPQPWPELGEARALAAQDAAQVAQTRLAADEAGHDGGTDVVGQRSRGAEGPALGIGQDLVAPLGEHLEQLEERGGIGRGHRRHVLCHDGELKDQSVLEVVVLDLERLGRHHVLLAREPRHLAVDVTRRRAERLTRGQLPLDGRARDAEQATGERPRHRAILDVGKEVLQALVALERALEQGHVLRGARGATGLRVEDRRVQRESRLARLRLRLHIRSQRLVALHRNGAAEVVDRPNAREAVLAAEARVAVARHDAEQHVALRRRGTARCAHQPTPERGADQAHAAAQQEVQRLLAPARDRHVGLVEPAHEGRENLSGEAHGIAPVLQAELADAAVARQEARA